MKPLVDCNGPIWIRAQSVNWLIDVFGEGYPDITLKQKLTKGYYPLPGQKQKTTGEGRGGGITHFDLEKAKYKQEWHYPLDKWDMGNLSKLIQNCIAFISWMYYIACRPGLNFLGGIT